MINFNQNKENTIISKESLNISNYEDAVNTTTNKKLCNNEEINSKLEYFIEKKKIPHIIFHGESDSEKNKLLLNFIKRIYNYDKKMLSDYVMYVNCAHTKGIRFIRDELKFFAKTNIQITNYVLFKSIVLFNADKLTIDAQSALRRCIEQFSNNTRFFIIVENKHKLLNPILSRFCEIYVPEYIDGGNITNLHRKMNNMSENVCPTEHSWLSIKINELDDSVVSHSDLIELSNEIYQKGFSCLDLIHWVQDNNNIDELLKSSVIIYYDKIKLEYRSESLLIFVLLDYLYMRENKEINF